MSRLIPRSFVQRVEALEAAAEQAKAGRARVLDQIEKIAMTIATVQELVDQAIARIAAQGGHPRIADVSPDFGQRVNRNLDGASMKLFKKPYAALLALPEAEKSALGYVELPAGCNEVAYSTQAARGGQI